MNTTPNRRAIIVAQMDSAEGFTDEEGNIKKVLHVHVCLSDADIYDYKAVPKDRQAFSYLKNTFDEFISKRYAISIDNGRKLKRRKYLQGKLVPEDQKDEQGKFMSYIADIKDRISQCINSSKTIEDFWQNLNKFGISVSHRERKKTHDTYETYFLHDLSNVSDRSKDKNGNIKKLAKKAGQLPSIRSYKHSGLSADEIDAKIQANASKVYKYEEASAETKHNIKQEKISHKTDKITNAKQDKDLIEQAINLTKTLINSKKQEEQEKEKTDQRYNLAQAELSYKRSKQIQKSL